MKVPLLLLFLCLGLALGAGQLKCDCHSKTNTVSFRWKNVVMSGSKQSLVGVWQLTPDLVDAIRSTPDGLEVYTNYAVDYAVVTDVDGKLETSISSDVSLQDGYSTYCILQESNMQYPTVLERMSPQCSFASRPNPNPSAKTTSFATIGVIAGLLIFVLILVLLRQRLQKLKEQERNLQTLRASMTNNTVEMQPMATHQVVELENNNVQIFPVHPMMQTYQPVPQQDPLGTLAPVYSSTYVQPGIQ